MAKTRLQKEEMLSTLVEALKAKPEIAVFTSQTGVSVIDNQELRNTQKEEGSKVMATKKTLLDKALAKEGFEMSLEEARGVITVTFNYDKAIAPTKIISKFQKDNEGLKILGGIYEGKIVGPEVIMELSTLPTFEEAIAKFMFAMKGVANKFAATLEALREKREQEEGSEADSKEEEVKEDKKEEKAEEPKKDADKSDDKSEKSEEKEDKVDDKKEAESKSADKSEEKSDESKKSDKK